MAANALRLRRSLALTSSLLNHPRHFSSVLPSVAAPPSSPSTFQQNPSLFDVNHSKPNSLSFQFISSRTISSRARYNDAMDGDQISPDAILFEGCDYNHWLITMDFPKDPKPSPEEMVETYVQTAAKVLGSVEEAKKKIYACSTTTYNGFQVEVSEEVSEQFKGLPGVVFVLPDSYIDPVNKEYGGDKYMNGTIIPRPPPVQYGRQGGRYNDRNREYNRPPPRGQMEQNGPPGRQGNYQGDRRGPMPPYQPNYNQGNPPPSRQTDFPQRDQGNFSPPPPVSGGYNQGSGGGYRQGTEGQYGQGGGYGGQQPGGGNFRQGPGGQYGQGGGGGYSQGGGGNYGQGGYGQGGGGGGGYGQGGGGGYGQGAGGQYGQGGGGGGYGQGGDRRSSQYGDNPRFSEAGQQGSYGVTEDVEGFKER